MSVVVITKRVPKTVTIVKQQVSAPVLLAVSPNTGPIAGGTSVTLTGYGFTGATSSSLLQPGFTVVSDTQITGVTVPGAVGVVAATISNSLYTSSPLANAFTYVNIPAVLFSVDFTQITPGSLAAGAGAGSAFEVATGLRLTRASTATVQTSDRLIVSGLANDTARVGQYGTSALTRGLSFEEARTNVVVQNRDLNNAAYSAGTATQTSNFANGPDGTLHATRVNKTAVQFSNYQQIPAAANGRYCWSLWTVSRDGTSVYASTMAEGSGLTSIPLPVGATWSRFIYNDATVFSIGNGLYIVAVWNDSNAADVLVDFLQQENGGFATEAIIVGASAATRAGEHLYHPTGAALLNAGRLRLNLQIIPKGATGDYSASNPLFYLDANNNAIVDTSGNFTAKIGGTSVTFSTPVTWAQRDLLEIFLEVGGGAASSLTTSVNGSTPLVQSGASLGALSIPSTLDLLCQSTTAQFSSWVQKIEAYS